MDGTSPMNKRTGSEDRTQIFSSPAEVILLAIHYLRVADLLKSKNDLYKELEEMSNVKAKRLTNRYAILTTCLSPLETLLESNSSLQNKSNETN
jgi:hypothetical protein